MDTFLSVPFVEQVRFWSKTVIFDSSHEFLPKFR
jgi:hypothetical protein